LNELLERTDLTTDQELFVILDNAVEIDALAIAGKLK
jgi:hypothetical protein